MKLEKKREKEKINRKSSNYPKYIAIVTRKLRSRNSKGQKISMSMFKKCRLLGKFLTKNPSFINCPRECME